MALHVAWHLLKRDLNEGLQMQQLKSDTCGTVTYPSIKHFLKLVEENFSPLCKSNRRKIQ
ncbi:hypothetical protein S2091_4042 [Solimicrobium silvestre]|uniref:Uncharacterized protein n=1 Tax=Solimicrobium silvestre TaxID=2099400 RepID=A0A2S9GU48_9BURK|nr:hypothetical protein S2091_4042 [Solimicrobium silvestre]